MVGGIEDKDWGKRWQSKLTKEEVGRFQQAVYSTTGRRQNDQKKEGDQLRAVNRLRGEKREDPTNAEGRESRFRKRLSFVRSGAGPDIRSSQKTAWKQEGDRVTRKTRNAAGKGPDLTKTGQLQISARKRKMHLDCT